MSYQNPPSTIQNYTFAHILVVASVADPYHLDADPDSDPVCHSDSDPDPVCQFDAGPNPDPNFHFYADADADSDPNPSIQNKGSKP